MTSRTTTQALGRAPSGNTGRPAGARRRMQLSRHTVRAAALFLAPAFVLLIILRLIPMFGAAQDSFKRDSMTAGGGRWVGLENYEFLVSDPAFWDMLGTTGIFLLIIVPFQTVIAIALAVLLVERVPGVGFMRTLVFVPVAAPAAVATVVWGIAYQPRGPINGVLEVLGIPAQPFLTSSDQALFAIIILMSWIGIGYWTLFLIAAIQDIPREQYEASALDGAGWLKTFWYITLPHLRRTLAFVVVANTVSSALAFVPIQILTKGGPAGSTRLIMYDLYNTTFLLGDVNLGQAMVVILLVFLITITVVQFRMLNKES